VYCVPANATTTHMLVVTGRVFGHHNPLLRLLDETNRIIIREDQRVVESSQPAEVPPAGDEKSVASDGPTLLFRRYYYDTLKTGDGPLMALGRAAAALVSRSTEG